MKSTSPHLKVQHVNCFLCWEYKYWGIFKKNLKGQMRDLFYCKWTFYIIPKKIWSEKYYSACISFASPTCPYQYCNILENNQIIANRIFAQQHSISHPMFRRFLFTGGIWSCNGYDTCITIIRVQHNGSEYYYCGTVHNAVKYLIILRTHHPNKRPPAPLQSAPNNEVKQPQQSEY